MAQPGLTSYEPAYADELAAIMEHGFRHMQAEDGGSLYLRLSTRGIPQPDRPAGLQREAVIEGGYWLRPPSATSWLAIAYCGAIAPEAQEAADALAERYPGLGLLAITSPDQLYQDWTRAQAARRAGKRASSPIERLLSALPIDAGLVTVLDGHPATLAWLGGVQRNRVQALGVTQFGQSADLPDTYALHGIDAAAIIAAAAALARR